MIALNHNGIYIVLHRWNAEVADAAERHMQFGKDTSVIQWLDHAFPQWRRYVYRHEGFKL